MRLRVAEYVAGGSLRGEGQGSFLFVQHAGRAIELSLHEGRWWIQFWERSDDDDSPPQQEHWAASEDDALHAVVDWLRPGVGASVKQ
jgi:hypothetical protein